MGGGKGKGKGKKGGGFFRPTMGVVEADGFRRVKGEPLKVYPDDVEVAKGSYENTITNSLTGREIEAHEVKNTTQLGYLDRQGEFLERCYRYYNKKERVRKVRGCSNMKSSIGPYGPVPVKVAIIPPGNSENTGGSSSSTALNRTGTIGGGNGYGPSSGNNTNNSQNQLKKVTGHFYYQDMKSQKLMVDSVYFPLELVEARGAVAGHGRDGNYRGSKRDRQTKNAGDGADGANQDDYNDGENSEEGSDDDGEGGGGRKGADNGDSDLEGFSDDDDIGLGDEDYAIDLVDADANDFGEVEEAGGNAYED